jgi:hypothetical protein
MCKRFKKMKLMLTGARQIGKTTLVKEIALHFDISEKTFGKLPKIGLEPTHLTAPDPKSGVSANFTTWALT